MATEYDAYVRQALYFEAVKEGEGERFSDDVAAAIAAGILALLLARGVNRLSDLSRRELRTLISEIVKEVARQLRELARATDKAMKEVFEIDKEVTGAIAAGLTGAPKAPRAALTYDDMAESIMPTVGASVAFFIAHYFAELEDELRRSIEAAYVDNVTVTQYIRAMWRKNDDPTARKGKNIGLIAKWQRDFKSTVRTALQHSTSWVGAAIGKLYTDTYEWISVLDSHTTVICGSRNGNIYVYGKGPLPPAHYNCRSRTRPVLSAVPSPTLSFFNWVLGQPAPIQDVAIGRKMAMQLRQGKIGAKEIAGFRPHGTLTAKQYGTKVASILS